ncbi:unnamed protein product, partial [Rotaria sp. Silwood2]
MFGDSINPPITTTASVDDGNEQSSTWVDTLAKLDRLCSRSLLRLCYNIIDVILLSCGLYYGAKPCIESKSF